MANLPSRLAEIPGGRRTSLVFVGLVGIAVIIAFARWATAPVWQPLFQRLPVDEVGSVTEALDDAGIEYRLEQGGSGVSVQAGDLARARVLLAGEGIPSAGGPGFELFDQPSWSMTDFTQRVNYRRALEGELERTMRAMRGIRGANVHLTLRRESFLRDAEDPPRASVVLSLSGPGRPEESVVRGMQALVASSVEGLDVEHVRVLDDSGQLLSSLAGGGAVDPFTDRQLAIQERVDGYLSSKAEELLTEIVGPENAKVRVSTRLNFDRIDRTVRSVDPAERITTREDRSEIIPGPEDEGAESVVTNAEFDATRSVETLVRGGSRIERITVAVLVRDRTVSAESGEEDGESREVVHEPRSPEELARIEALVRDAVGLDPNRGDRISVASVPFFDSDPPEPAPRGIDPVAVAQVAWRPALGGFAILFSFLLALRLLAAVREVPAAGSEPGARSLPGEREDADRSETSLPEEGAGKSARLQTPEEPVREVEVEDPELTARVVKAWLKEN